LKSIRYFNLNSLYVLKIWQKISSIYRQIKHNQAKDLCVFIKYLFSYAIPQTVQIYVLVKAEPVLEEAARDLAPENAIFITVFLPRDQWKDKNCVFRTDSRFRLSSIPSLLKWPNPQPKLEEELCADMAALKDFFEECA